VHLVGAHADGLAQKLELAAPHHHQHRLAALQAVLHEGTRALDELVIAHVEHSLVMKSSRAGHDSAHRLVIPGCPEKVARWEKSVGQAATAL
jgi:hypothetical protein